MSDTPRVDVAIGPGPHDLNPGTDFVKLAAVYVDVLNLARQMEHELQDERHHNSVLAAGQCSEPMGDDHGHQRCGKDNVIEHLERELAEAKADAEQHRHLYENLHRSVIAHDVEYAIQLHGDTMNEREPDEISIPESRAEMLAYINATPPLLSLLYDLDLMPEQVEEDSEDEERMFKIADHWNANAALYDALNHDFGKANAEIADARARVGLMQTTLESIRSYASGETMLPAEGVLRLCNAALDGEVSGERGHG